MCRCVCVWGGIDRYIYIYIYIYRARKNDIEDMNFESTGMGALNISTLYTYEINQNRLSENGFVNFAERERRQLFQHQIWRQIRYEWYHIEQGFV